MPARKTTTGKSHKPAHRPIVFLHAEGTFAADRAWLEFLLSLDADLFSHASLPGTHRTAHGIEQLGALAAELGQQHPDRPVVFVRAGLDLRQGDLDALVAQLEAPGCSGALTTLSNAAPAVNPLAGLRADTQPQAAALRDAVRLMGAHTVHPWPWWPAHLLALSATGCAALGRGEPARRLAELRVTHMLGLVEWLFVPDLRSPWFASERLEPHETPRPAAWGVLSRQLQTWLDNGSPEPGFAADSRRPVTLHITHSWGGGVSLWTQTFIDADESCDHLQLRSEGPQSGEGNGQRLSLYAGNAIKAPIASWWLQPPIRSVETHNGQYAEVLATILARFPVNRVLVSSLVGHSLDAFATGVPTIQVLHDHFPLWPLLSVHPAEFLTPEGPDLERALRDHVRSQEFTDRDAAGWRAVGDAYVQALETHEVCLAAPSQSVIELTGQLDPRMQAFDIARIPHAPPPMATAGPIAPRPRADGRLRLIVPGRIQPGKGKELLLEALPRLSEFAHIYLLGSGKHGEDFFGLPGVSVLLQYDREALPGLLADIGPHAAALLSIVPETFSYTLTELAQFGLPVIATRRGSFSERIEHNRTGWLIEPTADDLVATVERFWKAPDTLVPLGEALQHETSSALEDMVAAYKVLWPPGQKTPDERPAARGISLTEAQAVSATDQAVVSAARAADAQAAQRDAERELVRRSDWAEKADRALKEIEVRNAELEQELAERERWARQANADAESARAHVAELEALVEDRTTWAQQESARAQTLEVQLKEARNTLTSTENELKRIAAQLEETRQKLHKSRNDLQTVIFEQQLTELERKRLQDMQDLILGSLSWRMTRPLRAGNRALRNAWQARIYNPARWPLLLSKLARYLVTQGPGGTLKRLQAPAQSDSRQSTQDSAANHTVRPPRRTAPNPSRPPESQSPVPGSTAPKKRDLESTPPETESLALEAAEPEAPITFAAVDKPVASIVIPVYNQWAYTRRCLASLAEIGSEVPFDVIVVDDASSDETELQLAKVAGITVLRNDDNAGFIASCNRGAKQARGEYIILLNNDTEVTEGWLERLLGTFERVPDAGLVGARLVYPDGTLQECGGIVFNDGSGWNYGKHDDADRPDYQYLREVDYCSGACIALRTSTWRELDGFDDHYAPAYYEDTDLAFRVREMGLKVLVQPEATIVHHEGITSGTDTASGTKRFQDVNRAKFLQRWQAQLQHQPDPIDDPEDLAQVRRARDHRCRGRVLVIDATTPEPDQDSGSVRLTNILRCLRDLGYSVTFFADNRMHAGRYTRAIQRAGIEVQYLPWLDPLKAFFEQRGAEYDFVFISRHYIAVNYLSLLKQHCLDAPFIFDTVDLHYLREQRLAELEKSTTLRQVAKQTRRSELSVIAAADATVVVSPTEVDVLAKDAPGARVHVLSNIHEVPGRRAAFSDRKDLFFVGGYQHPPNIDAAVWFVREIWPLVREQLPDARFHLIGSKATEAVSGLAGDGVIFHGFVDDLEPWLDGCRLAVAPLRYGAGVKGKVNMSMSYGQPVVATPVAVEGMFAEHGRDVLVAESPANFAAEVVRLYTDEALWLNLSDAAVENVERHFSLGAARQSLEDLLTTLDETR